MLNKLAKKDKMWREIAFKICKDNMLADDLVNDMYLKLMGITKQIKDSYVKRVILNLFYDHLRSKKKIVSIENIKELNIDSIDYELDDYKLSLLSRLTE